VSVKKDMVIMLVFDIVPCRTSKYKYYGIPPRKTIYSDPKYVNIANWYH